MQRACSLLIFFLLPLALFADATPFRNIDPATILLGVEYTFQDQEMVNEPGRRTFETPHKRARFEAFKKAYLEVLDAAGSTTESFGNGKFKTGDTITVPNDGSHVINMEPVTIEVNTSPKHLDELENAAQKVFLAASRAALVAYVNPAAERSGMGHVHVGARKIADSPFYKNPLLLRNMMVFEHKHPAILWGFAEAYDIDDFEVRSGKNVTNIGTYHKPGQQKAFERAVANFDRWYAETKAKGGDLRDGLRQYLKCLKAEQKWGINFFHHYRFMNLENLEEFADSPVPIDLDLEGKYTVEFRNFRPPKSPKHTVANAELLLTLMDKQAEPNHLEKFVAISPEEYDRFHSASVVAADWEEVKGSLPRHNALWDESVHEYVQVQLGQAPRSLRLPSGEEAELYSAYAPKTRKGTKFEIRLAAKEDLPPPHLEIGRQNLGFQRVKVSGKDYWVSVVNKTQLDFLAGVDPRLTNVKLNCSRWYSTLKGLLQAN
jgi:Putative amidoligase enzyme (DUF2126)